MAKCNPISFDGIKTCHLKDRASKVSIDDFGRPWVPGGDMSTWLMSLPRILAGNDMRRLANRIVEAARSGKIVILGMGAHAVKVGLSPIIIDLMERGVIKGVAMNGAGIIHDSEIAMAGKTSEDVSAGLQDGTFGMAEETGRLLNEAIIEGARQELGLGRAVGAMLKKEDFPYNHLSILAKGFDLNIPVTVHVAIGTDIIHFHPNADGAAIGRTSHMDFRIFADLVSRLENGVFINLGSAVMIPEVFLKALTLARNLGKGPVSFTTANMDFIKTYRGMTNVVQRPVQEGGEGYNLIGHHEIMFPMLAAAVIEGLEGKT